MHRAELRQRQLIADVTKDPRQRNLQRVTDRGEQLRACFLLTALDLGQVTEGDPRVARDLAQGAVLGEALAARLSETPGASETFRGGIVAYQAELKDQLLGANAVARGAVTEETAQRMAAGARERLGATWGLATTGVAGPTESEGHPVGTLYLGLAGPDGTQTRHVQLPGDRPMVRMLSVVQALDLLRRTIQR